MQRTPVFAQLWRNSNRDVVIVRECSTEPIFFRKANTIFKGVTAKKLLTTVQTIPIFTERRIEIRNMTSLLAEM